MELGTAIFGVIAIGICFLPLLFIQMGKKKKEKQYVDFLSKIASQNNCQIHKHEFFGSFVIGFDEAKKFAFYVKQLESSTIEKWVDLNEIQSCTADNVSRTFTSKGENRRIIERVELNFISSAKKKPPVVFEFFNASEDGQLSGELQAIEKWSKIFNGQLTRKK